MQKVLVITYYWPPAGGPGVQRWLKFVKYLRDFAFEPVVYIPENPNYPIQDSSLVAEIPEGIQIFSHPIKEPYRWASFLSSKKTKRISSGIIQTQNQSLLEKAMLWVRGNFFIPDARKNWIRPSIAYLSELIKTEGIEMIVTTGPPHSVHLIGLGLKERCQLKWLADFRDPWTSIGYHKKLRLTPTSQRKHERLEREVLQTADALVVTSNNTKREFQRVTEVPLHVITNGYDVTINPNTDLDARFSVSHIGSLLTGRSPANLWQVLGELVRENKDFASAFELRLIGVVSQNVLEEIYGYGLEPYVRLTQYVSHEEAVRRQRESQLLLMIEIDAAETVGIVPGKVFEYLAAKRPILAVGPTGWDAAEIIGECKAGAVFDYQETAQLKRTVLEWFGLYREKRLQINSVGIEKYSRKQLTARLSEVLQTLCQ